MKGVTAYTEGPQSQPEVKKGGVYGFFPSHKSLIKNSLYATESTIFFFFLVLFIYLTALGLRCHTPAFSVCSACRLLSSCRVWVSYCCGFSCCKAWGLGQAGSTVVSHGLSCPMAYGILLDQGSNPCLLHWQVEFSPLRYHGIPERLDF